MSMAGRSGALRVTEMRILTLQGGWLWKLAAVTAAAAFHERPRHRENAFVSIQLDEHQAGGRRAAFLLRA